MEEIISFLEQYSHGVFSTVDGAQPKSRVFQYLFAEGRKVYFCTAKNKPVFKQLETVPNASFCVSKPDFSYVLSIDGPVTIVEDLQVKQRVLDENSLIKNIYKENTNPDFVVFYIDVQSAETFSFSAGTKRYHFK